MLSLGVISIALCAVQVITLPLSNPASEDDTKVMKCILEVISDTLSKPSPVPISQDCLHTLRGDERIISILRHQNLLKELQELATQGIAERAQKKKKSASFEDELSEVLARQNNKPVRSEKSAELPAEELKTLFTDKSEESEEKKRDPEEERGGKSGLEQEAPGKSRGDDDDDDDSAEELENNEINKREEAPGDGEIDNHITDDINDRDLAGDKALDISEDRTSEETDTTSKMSQKDAEPEDAEERRDFEKETPKRDSNETEDEEDETQREDNSMKLVEEQDFDKEEATSEVESSKEGGHPDDEAMQAGGNSHQREPKSEEETSSKEMEDSKRWNKMDELAKQLTSKKWVEDKSREEDPDQSMKIPPKKNKYEPSSQEDRRTWKQSRGDSREDEPQVSKRPEPEERKEEEGSANRKTEDQELESLAAIEAELESVAHKLQELRRG
ncbi:chromogranin-A [Rhinophrynus dorsalis]